MSAKTFKNATAIAACTKVILEVISRNLDEIPDGDDGSEMAELLRKKGAELLELVPYKGDRELTHEQQLDRAIYKIAMMQLGRITFSINREFSPRLMAGIAAVMTPEDDNKKEEDDE
jgi:hypothetical protein